MDQVDWPALSREEKKKQLYLTQKDLLDKFLERNAITKEKLSFSQINNLLLSQAIASAGVSNPSTQQSAGISPNRIFSSQIGCETLTGSKDSLKKIVLRDFESIDKDITIRTPNDKDINFQEYPYKCIAQEDDNYLKRHSFMYDHKLGEYLIDPLVEEFCKFTNFNTCEVQAIIRENVRSRYSGRLDGFFPQDGCWYKYPNTEIDRSTNK